MTNLGRSSLGTKVIQRSAEICWNFQMAQSPSKYSHLVCGLASHLITQVGQGDFSRTNIARETETHRLLCSHGCQESSVSLQDLSLQICLPMPL